MPSIAETAAEMIQWVFPEHAGAPGQIHGGRMMQWIAQAGTMAAGRVARGTVVLGAMDDIDFLHPVKVGQIAILRAQVEYVGTSSLEIGVRVWGEDVATGERTVTLNSHLVFVHVDEQTRPRPVGDTIRPADRGEALLLEAATLDRRIDAYADTQEYHRLVAVLNTMLGRLEHAFEAQRRFAAEEIARANAQLARTSAARSTAPPAATSRSRNSRTAAYCRRSQASGVRRQSDGSSSARFSVLLLAPDA